MKIEASESLLPQGEGHDCMDAGGRATQEAKAEDEGINKNKALAFLSDPLTLTLSLRERGLSGTAMEISRFFPMDQGRCRSLRGTRTVRSEPLPARAASSGAQAWP